MEGSKGTEPKHTNDDITLGFSSDKQQTVKTRSHWSASVGSFHQLQVKKVSSLDWVFTELFSLTLQQSETTHTHTHRVPFSIDSFVND